MFNWSLRLLAGGMPVAQRCTRPLLAQLGRRSHSAGAKCDTSTMPSWGGSDGAYMAPTAPAHPSLFSDKLAFQRLAAAGSFTLCMPPYRPPSQPISQSRCQPAAFVQLLCASSAACLLRSSPASKHRTERMPRHVQRRTRPRPACYSSPPWLGTIPQLNWSQQRPDAPAAGVRTHQV